MKRYQAVFVPVAVLIAVPAVFACVPPRLLTPDIIEGTPGNPQSRNRYASCLNDPVVYVDHNGMEPTRAEAGTLGQVLWQIKNVESRLPSNLSRRERLNVMTKFFKEGGIKFGDYVIGGKYRYMHTEDVGWIDLKHFFKAADLANKVGSDKIARIGGLLIEISQVGSDSFFFV